ncbi:hypothetical protein F5050DRAFT_1715872 [Lentinula boryana]|uniref:Uncharacterized protein n=1 Tax=Lentinula boryana TaxID=40481 RepID=A0ABQ8PZA1_9AGAR|nr:hypothetical protein F5050DRAFT_1715872 [Lentinula boryana]
MNPRGGDCEAGGRRQNLWRRWSGWRKRQHGRKKKNVWLKQNELRRKNEKLAEARRLNDERLAEEKRVAEEQKRRQEEQAEVRRKKELAEAAVAEAEDEQEHNDAYKKLVEENRNEKEKAARELEKQRKQTAKSHCGVNVEITKTFKSKAVISDDSDKEGEDRSTESAPKGVKRKWTIKMIAKGDDNSDPNGESNHNAGHSPRNDKPKLAWSVINSASDVAGLGIMPHGGCEENGLSWMMRSMKDPPRALGRGVQRERRELKAIEGNEKDEEKVEDEDEDGEGEDDEEEKEKMLRSCELRNRGNSRDRIAEIDGDVRGSFPRRWEERLVDMRKNKGMDIKGIVQIGFRSGEIMGDSLTELYSANAGIGLWDRGLTAIHIHITEE